MNREEKKTAIAELREALGDNRNAFVLGFSGITVPDVTELRRQVKESRSSYRVIKNTLALRAVEGGALEVLREHFTGPTAVAYNADAPIALAKLLSNFAKTNPALVFKAGIVEGRPVSAAEIVELAELPTREQLLARLVFLLQSPVRRLAMVLNGPARNFVSVLSQIAEQKSQSAPAAPAAPGA
jgi:large subunit ribosomal protein L10